LNADKTNGEANDGADEEGFSELLTQYFLKILLHSLEPASSAFKNQDLTSCNPTNYTLFQNW
jgi:hypothetical protein